VRGMILVAEDQDSARESLAELLRGEAYEVQCDPGKLVGKPALRSHSPARSIAKKVCSNARAAARVFWTGEMPLSLQPKLLRVLEEKTVLSVRSTTPVKVNVRILAASNRDLNAEVEASAFAKISIIG
jgi:DNA-binding NtrC family response regulator